MHRSVKVHQAQSAENLRCSKTVSTAYRRSISSAVSNYPNCTHYPQCSAIRHPVHRVQAQDDRRHPHVLQSTQDRRSNRKDTIVRGLHIDNQYTEQTLSSIHREVDGMTLSYLYPSITMKDLRYEDHLRYIRISVIPLILASFSAGFLAAIYGTKPAYSRSPNIII